MLFSHSACGKVQWQEDMYTDLEEPEALTQAGAQAAPAWRQLE